jgi:hypothetical protein
MNSRQRLAIVAMVLSAWFWAVHASLSVLSASPQPIGQGTTQAQVDVNMGETCPVLTYKQPPMPDKIRLALANRQQYQLVISADTFALSPESDRAYVRAAGELVSERLSALGYSPLPSLVNDHITFLSGDKASKKNVWAAIQEMADIVGTSDRPHLLRRPRIGRAKPARSHPRRLRQAG